MSTGIQTTFGTAILRCDVCGRVHLDNDAADSESCECGRLKPRMDWLTFEGIQQQSGELSRLRAALSHAQQEIQILRSREAADAQHDVGAIIRKGG